MTRITEDTQEMVKLVEGRVSRALYDAYANHDYANGSVWEALAKAALEASQLAGVLAERDALKTLVLNMRLALDTALKHKFETQTHGGLTEFGEGGLAALKSLEREFAALSHQGAKL